jgi:glycosyltransferase involved in cell wall biosynthesis
MKILLIGDYSSPHDEGMKKLSHNIKNHLSRRHQILAINPKDIFKVIKLNEIRNYNPEILHYIPGPTIRSLVILIILKMIITCRPVSIVSAVRPYFTKYNSWLIPAFKPDLVLTQSSNFEKFFKKKGCLVKFFPNGVDCQKYIPATENQKRRLRQNFDLPINKKIILHVGHLKNNRGLKIFSEIQHNHKFQIVVVGSSQKTNVKLVQELKESGVKIFDTYFNDISALYQLADLYLFPVPSIAEELPSGYNQVGAIDLPLSILEAMACNLPIVTTAFGALGRVFQTGEGLYFYKNKSELLHFLDSALNCKNIQTRKKVSHLDWRFNAGSLETIYRQMLF